MLCFYALPNPMSMHPTNLDRMSRHVVMGYEPKMRYFSPMTQWIDKKMSCLVIDDLVKHRLYHNVHIGLIDGLKDYRNLVWSLSYAYN